MSNISASGLAKRLKKSTKETYEQLRSEKLILKEGEAWVLTTLGYEFGGEIIDSKKYGSFVAWPEDFDPFNLATSKKVDLFNVSKLIDDVEISAQRLNLVLAEIGWIEKTIKGWSATGLGKKVGGVTVIHSSGNTYVLWPKSILASAALKESISGESQEPAKKFSKELNDFRTKFPAEFRTKDGHTVRSRAEVIIDNALYDYGLAHAYERRLPIQEDVYCDFYIPSKNSGKAVYIEFWGLEDEPKYAERKKKKIQIYQENNLNLIELKDKHLVNLDDHLPSLLLKFDIKVE
ncbi:MAG: glycerol kinase [Cyclobacteriaceae bacterium]